MAKTWQIYLVRHAIAAERGQEWPDDDKRPLTAEGVARFKQAVKGLVWLGAPIGQVFTSPLVRARQTADLLVQGVAPNIRVQTLETLAPGHAPAKVLAELGATARSGPIALVGHEPDLGELAAHLVGASRPFVFKKGGVCLIDLDRLSAPAAGRLVWFVDPRVLRRLGG